VSSPACTLIQLTDTHLSSGNEPMHGQVDTLANLAAAVHAIAAAGDEVHGLLLTGDLTNDGAPEAYRTLRSTVERLGVPVVYAMGNHDERVAFRTELLGEPGDAPCDAVHWFGGVRVIVLDSTTPGRHDGHLTESQLDWLGAELSTSAPRGTVLVLHHPPLPSPVPTVHLLRLRDTGRLAAVLAGTDVRIVLTGHAHHTGCGSLAGIPVWVSPALAYRVDTLPPKDRLVGAMGGGFTRIDLIDGVFVATAVHLGPHTAVYDRDRAEAVDYIASVVG
jgi:Icc protein